MNKAEIRNLLKRREELSDICAKMQEDCMDNNNSPETNTIYRDSLHGILCSIYSIDNQLKEYVERNPVGSWLLQIRGMSQHNAAGLLAYFNIEGKDCAAQFIKYSGADNCNSPHNNNVRSIMDEISTNFKSEIGSLYGKLYEDKLFELLGKDLELSLAKLRADRFMRKVFISHLFEEMYREKYNTLPNRHTDTNRLIIEPEVPYTR